MLIFLALHRVLHRAWRIRNCLSLFELSKMVRGIVIFVAAALFVRSERELRLFVLGLGLAVCYEGVQGLVPAVFLWDSSCLRRPGRFEQLVHVLLHDRAPLCRRASTRNFPNYLKLLSSAAICLAAWASSSRFRAPASSRSRRFCSRTMIATVPSGFHAQENCRRHHVSCSESWSSPPNHGAP